MVSPLIKRTASAVHIPIDDTQGIVVSYTRWLMHQLVVKNSEGLTLTFLDIIELSTGTVNLGLAFREPLASQLRSFCDDTGFDYDVASNVLHSFANEVVNTLLQNGACTIHGVGQLKLSDKGNIRFWSSSNYARQGYSLRSAVNPVFRANFNKLNTVATEGSY